MRITNKSLESCPFFLAGGDTYILCEGLFNGTMDKHIFKSVREREGYEKFVCSKNCGKTCLHYKRVNELYEKGLR